MKVKVYNQRGQEIGQESLKPEIFGLQVDPALVQQVVIAQMANRRQVIAHTKDRSEVRGGGVKPWRQKGTGRARHGSIRSPLWRGGGITFGPTKDRNFTLKVNRKLKRRALLMSLSDRAQNKRIVVFDQLKLTAAKTKELVNCIQKLPVKGKLLLLFSQADQKVVKAARNLKAAKLLAPDSLNVVDILWADYLVLSTKALRMIEKVYSPKKS